MFTAIIINYSLKNWEKFERVIEHDVHNYYGYLPLMFIYDDIRIDDKERYNYYTREDGYKYYSVWSIKTDDGRNVIKGPIGMVYFYAPFFFAAHFIALNSQYEADGFSMPYKIMLIVSTLVFLFIGLIFLNKILNHFNFNKIESAITLIAIGISTNLLAYATTQAALTHVYSFTLIAIFMHFTHRWHDDPKRIWNIIALGLTMGLITLIRPTNGIVALYFLWYGIESFSTFKHKLALIQKHILGLLLIIPIAFLIWIPQFLYWKISTGSYLYYSFQDEGFYFNDPQILNGLFSFRKGWLIYTPVMAFSLLGLFFMKDSYKKAKVPIVLFVILNLYIVFSWWCWWYGGSIGQRVLIDSYALLAIPLASFISFIIKKGKVLYLPGATILLFLIWLNIFQIYQYENTSLHHDSMSRKLYFKQFGKIEQIPDFYKYVDWVDYDKYKYRNKNLDK